MKNTLRLIGIIALAVIIGFSMTACDPNNGDQNCATCGKLPCECQKATVCTECGEDPCDCPTSSDCAECGENPCECPCEECDAYPCECPCIDHNIVGGICTKCGVLRLSNLDVVDEDDSGITEFTQANFGHTYGSLTDFITGTPKVQITEGKLTIELDQPKSEHIVLAEVVFGTLSAEPNDSSIFPIFLFYDEDGYFELILFHHEQMQRAYLIYVDKDVVLNGGDWNFNNLTLKKGWNYLIFGDGSTSSSQTLPEGFGGTILDD